MSKQSNQKLKLLYLKDYLERETDENHPTTVKRIIEYMESLGIPCERKTVYADIDELKRFGLDIISTKGNKAGYYLAGREFEPIELRILIDALTTSKFLTPKKTSALIDKLLCHSSVYEKAWLKNRVYSGDSLKNSNEKIYYTVDSLHKAIVNRKCIDFLYWRYSARKQKVYRNDGFPYIVEPYMLTYNDGCYYLVAKDVEEDRLKTFRIDKIEDVHQRDEDIVTMPEKEKIETYIKGQFSMFDGETTDITIRFKESLVGVMVDKFGNDVAVQLDKEGYPTMRVRVRTSVWFYSWLAGLGKDAEIVSPKKERQGYLDYLQSLINDYGISSRGKEN